MTEYNLRYPVNQKASYFGGENIGNYKQDKAILGANNPFGANFDTSISYAPIFGQMYYAGLRYKIK